MLFKDTPYKVIKYLAQFRDKKSILIAYNNENYIRFLLDRKAIEPSSKEFFATNKFYAIHLEEVINSFTLCRSFIEKYSLEYLENYYNIEEIEALMLIEREKEKIIESGLALTNILSTYFGSSKYRTSKSNLSKAIKMILEIDLFPEEIKNQQFISILYPKNDTRFIILCENINRLIIQRHQFIEFWYAGGKNIKQLEFMPKPKFEIYYLCDWDFDGLKTYVDIKNKFFPTLSAFIPLEPELLMIKQEKVKKHKSKWKNDSFFKFLDDRERGIAQMLFEENSIIEEQNILLTKESLSLNSII